MGFLSEMQKAQEFLPWGFGGLPGIGGKPEKMRHQQRFYHAPADVGIYAGRDPKMVGDQIRFERRLDFGSGWDGGVNYGKSLVEWYNVAANFQDGSCGRIYQSVPSTSRA